MSFFEFTPTHTSPDPLAEARSLCRRSPKESPFPPIEKIVAVGAVYDKDGLSDLDEYWLACAISLCTESGVPVSSSFQLTPLNLEASPNQDFLRPELELPTDLLILCYIFDPPDKKTPDKHGFSISERHFAPQAWPDAAKRSGAKVIIPFASRQTQNATEINKTHFDDSEYIDTRGPSAVTPLLIRSDLMNKLNKPTYGQMGI